MGSKLKRDSAILWAKKILICSISLVILGFGCGLNIATAKGADPITVFYEGLNKLTGISIDWVTWILNGSLVLLVFFINKKYVHKKPSLINLDFKFLYASKFYAIHKIINSIVSNI